MKRPELWLSYAFNESLGGYVAIASTKHPVLGDAEVNVVAHTFEPNEDACRRWFDQLTRAPQNGTIA